MRRGHPGIGGWRNETPRHFRPRGGGIPRYGHPQQYPRLNPHPEFGAHRLGPRPHRGGLHYNIHSGPPNNHVQYNRGRYMYRRGQAPRGDRDDRDAGERRSFPQPPHMRHNENSDDVSPYKHMLNHCRINNMGDVDHRQNLNMIESPFKQQPLQQWPNTFQTGTSSFGERSPHKRPNIYHDNAEGNQFTTFTGHRPPSSDHYGGNVASIIDNSNSFSRSVDDTVDIVRKRLLNRNEPHNIVDIPPVEQNSEESADTPAISSSYQNEPETPPAKKKTQRRQNVKSNCDKIKNKIVHQLFKMDKEKIHKLMDNPSSSTKFEYAISSLITESQNSLDRHLRSVAEKSLCSSSEEFIHNDNNTIYEDTFLKQMQCILEPQDTILLEDIKPLVMAELTKVLQLDEFEQRFDLGEEDRYFCPVEEHPPINYPNVYEPHSNEEFSDDVNFPVYPEEEISYHQEQSYSKSQYAAQDTPENPPDKLIQNQTLNERRSARKSCDVSEPRRKSMEDHEQVRISADRECNKFSEERHICEIPVPVFDREQARKSADRERNKFHDERRRCESPVPVFNANPDPNQLSDEEDPFADLDKQYHVAVDHNFIEEELDKQFMASNEMSQNEIEINSGKDKAQIAKTEVLLSPEIIDPTTVKKEIDNQILSIAKSPLKICSSLNRDKENHKSTSLSVPLKREVHDIANVDINIDDPENQNHDINNMDNINQDQSPEFNNAQKESERSQHPNVVKSTILPNARKRSIDQKPSHRKEKRKKSDTTPGEPNKQILNKNIIINVNDCSSKSTEKKCDAAKSIFNLFFSKDESGKELPRDNKNVELSDKGYSDKYVKRKETPKKKEHDSKRKLSSSTSHSIVSPKENNISCSETQSKVDAKIKLKPIDMFLDHPKKVLSTHLAHRNTAQATTPKKVEEKKPLLVPKSKTPKRHVATQVVFKMQTKETQTSLLKSSVSKLCQTETKKLTVKATQTNPVTFEKTGIKSSDTFERMKEIDLEIQVLLQEKFKLYNSLEAIESSSNAMHNLGMTVLNVTPIEEKDEAENEDEMSADSIMDEFTSIPVEELEQIALESVQEITSESPKVQKRNQRQKVLNNNKAKSQSPVTDVICKNKKKANAPNISLIEQIITDDRPLEEIISLDDLERAEDKPSNAAKKKRPQRPRPRRASKKKSAKKSKAVKPSNDRPQIIRECSVVLSREDISNYFNINNAKKNEQPPQKESKATLVQAPVIQKTEVAEISIPNEPADIQFDMLDVSEDIVIGTVCEVKSSEEKDVSGRDLSTSEDVILDNSQLSADDAMPADAGQSDECKMFDYSADEMLRRDSVTVTGNADAVLAIECIDNNFIAACLDGNVYYFSGDGQLLTTLRGSNLAVTCLTIVREKYGTTVYTGSLDSRIRYYDLDTGQEKGPECNVLSPIQTMDRAWDTVFVGTRTGFVLQFECKNNMLIPVSTVKFSEQSILALRALKEGPRKVLLVAARSENVTIKDAQTGLLLRTLEGPKMTVYTLLFEDGKVYCGTSSHQIHAFDYASGSHCGTHEGGKGCVCLRATGGLLFAGCYDGCVYVFREGEPRPFAQLRGPGLMLLSLAVVGTKIIAGYKDRSLYIWKIPLNILKEMIL